MYGPAPPARAASRAGLPLTLERQKKTSSCYRPDVALLATLRTQGTLELTSPPCVSVSSPRAHFTSARAKHDPQH